MTGTLALSLAATAQVPNGGFETHSSCPTASGQIDLATDWYSPTTGTPDYFHQCGTPAVGVPDNLYGTQSAHSGLAYSGLVIKNSGSASLEWREYVQVHLPAPLLIGVQYDLQMQVSLAEYSQFGSSAIGGLVSTLPITRYDNERLTQLPQAMNPVSNPVTDKSGWTPVTMPFIADSAYEYLTIGNFLNDANTSAVPVVGGTDPRAYFYLDDVSLSIAPNLQIQGNTSICVGDSTTLTALNDPDPAWALSTAPATILSTDLSITVSPGSTATYILYGATDTAYSTVTVHPYPTIDLGSDTTLCQGEMLTLDATTANAHYLWPDSSTSSSFNVAMPGTYWVDLSVSNCAVSDTIHVQYTPAPTIDLGNDTILCHGESLTLDATTAGATYVWHDSSTSPTFTVDQAGTYWATVSVNDCSATDSVIVSFQPLPTIDPGNDPTLCRGGTLTLDAATANGTYLWQDGSTGPTLTVHQEGTYEVTVIANGCSASVNIFISEEECAGTLVMPNVFTPDQDGINDRFTPVSTRGIRSMHTSIFNRWGQMIFETDLPSISWNGKEAPEGTYFWIVRYVDVNGNRKKAEGYVTLLR